MRGARRTATAFAPATVANVGSAFDVLGFALDSPGDAVTAHISSEPGVRITSCRGDGGRLPSDPERNVAGVAVLGMLGALRAQFPNTYNSIGIDIELVKGLPIGSGLGSSSASAVAAVLAANHVLGEPLARWELLPFAMEGERVACGAAHADNVAPSLLGGFVLIRSYEPLDLIQLPTPPNLWIAVVSPELVVRTADARQVLKRSMPFHLAVSQWGNVGALVAGIFQGDLALMGRALEDRVVEPERAQLISGYNDVKRAACEAGAFGCSISGSGPSMFALCGSHDDARRVADAMVTAFSRLQIHATPIVSKVNTRGAYIVPSRHQGASGGIDAAS